MSLWEQYSDVEFSDDCDLIYCGTVGLLEEALGFREGKDIPIVCWVWDLPCNWRMWCRDYEDWKVHAFRDTDILKKVSMLYCVDKILVPSEFTKNTLEVFGLKSERVPFYIDIDGLDKVNAGEKKNRVIQISRFALNKRFDLTLEAWAKIQDDFPDWELTFIGTGDKSHLEKLKVDLKIKNCLIYQDLPREATVRMLKESKILVSPSVFEGWGITPIEATRCGLSTVVSDLKVALDVGYGDYFFEGDNVDDYAKILKKAMTGGPTGTNRLRKKDEVFDAFEYYHPKKFAYRWRRAIETL